MKAKKGSSKIREIDRKEKAEKDCPDAPPTTEKRGQVEKNQIKDLATKDKKKKTIRQIPPKNSLKESSLNSIQGIREGGVKKAPIGHKGKKKNKG